MKKQLVLFCIALSFSVMANGQEKEKKFGIAFSGFVKTDIFYDTRQTVNIREGHFLFYPDKEVLDANKKDLNANPSFNMLSIQSRLKGAITGPDAFGAKTSGVLEADFFGNENASFGDINGFRLRHAFVKLNWAKSELLVGQYFHPMFIVEAFPDVVSFNTGVPFQPFARNPQIRYSYKTGDLKLTATAFTQRDFTGMGPDYTLKNGIYEHASVSSAKPLRNSTIPNLNFQVQYNPDSTEHFFGAGVDYKSIVPELFTVSNSNKRFASETRLNSISGIVYAKMKLKPITAKIEAVYAQNPTDMLMIGGYAVEKLTDTTGAKDFINLNTASLWMDVHTNGQKVQFGLFAGFTKNMGAKDSIQTTRFYARGSDIDQVFRVAPRVVFISGKLNIAAELEYTNAKYGTANSNGKGEVTKNLKSVANTRALLAFIYKF